MNSFTTKMTEWRRWSTIIFWGVVALTVFGWFAGFMELFTGITSTIQSVLGMMSGVGQMTDQMEYVNQFLSNFNQALGIFEFLTFASWVAYLVGLYKFRDAQTTMSAVAGVKAINNACWTGLVAVLFAMLAVWSPWIVGLILRFIGWIIGLVSYFMFRSAFRTMESESAWNEMARRGAVLLRKSANYNIWLQFMPIIIFFVVLIVGLTTFSSVMNASTFNYESDGSSMGVTEYIGLYIFIGIIFGLAILSLSILQLVYRIWGWNRVMRGAPVAVGNVQVKQRTVVGSGSFCSQCGCPVNAEARFCPGCGMEITHEVVSRTIVNEPEQESEINTVDSDDVSEYEYDDAPEDTTKKNWMIGGGIALIVVVILIFMVRSCSSIKEKIPSQEPTAEIVAEEESEEVSVDTESESISSAMTEETEDDWNATTTEVWEGTIGGKYKIAMTVNRLDGGVWGTYMYLSQNREIVLSGEWGDNNQLTLTESVDGNITGQFIGQYGRSTFEGLWISADGEKEMPFSVTLKSRNQP